MADVWLKHALRNWIKAAADAGIPLMEAKEPKKSSPRFSVVCDSMDPRHKGCVTVILPWWMSAIWLWWKMDKKGWRAMRDWRRASAHTRGIGSSGKP